VKILLLSMPDSFEHTPSLAIRIPNGGLASLAGNVDPDHEVAIADLILAQSCVRSTVERLVRDQQPDVVGLSVMTYQRATARRIISLVRSLRPQARIVVGGYDPSLAPDAYMHPTLGVDFIVRGEGDLTFRELIRALDAGRVPEGIPGLWSRTLSGFAPAPSRLAAKLDSNEVRRPRRSARVLDGYTFMGRPIDVVETSRGCTFDCSFCSIIEMRGRNFHRFPIEHVIADIADARDRGAGAIFIVDDNVTLDVPRFEAICEAITNAGLNDVDYLVQAMTASIAAGGDRLAARMRAAGFRYVFLGIENVIEEDLQFLKAQAKNRERGSRGNATIAAIETLHRHGMYIVGGLIVGNPDDTAESIEANLAFARKYVDWPYIQHPTPYPGTPMTADFISRRLIANPRFEEYDGTTAVTHARIDSKEIEFARWKAERWMKLKHMPVAVMHDPRWVMLHAWQMLAHTFRGSSWRSVLGLEDARAVFDRYRAIRARERQYIDWPDPLGEGAEQVGSLVVG
jgi:anaerobic magnesium-protoporphyrin IX monomethyl ester cyclase